MPDSSPVGRALTGLGADPKATGRKQPSRVLDHGTGDVEHGSTGSQRKASEQWLVPAVRTPAPVPKDGVHSSEKEKGRQVVYKASTSIASTPSLPAS